MKTETIEITKSIGHHHKGDTLDVAPVMAQRFIRQGYAKAVDETEDKAIYEPPQDKAIKKRKPARKKKSREKPAD